MEDTYFSKSGGELDISSEIKSLVTFGYLNLVEDAYPSLPTNTTAMDLILCRNVLMYFDDATVRKVVGRLRSSLADEGWLLVAPVEFSQSVFRDFKGHNFPGTVAYQKAEIGAPGAIDRRPRRAPRAHDRTSLRRPRDEPTTDDAEAKAHPKAATNGGPTGHVDDSLSEPSADDLAAIERQAMADPADSDAAYRAAKRLAGQLDLESAERWIETSIERAPLFAPGHYLKGLILLDAGRPHDALSALRRCVFSDPTFILGHFMLGGLFGRLGQTTRALKALDNAHDLLDGLDPTDPVPEGEGLTAGRLRELVDVQKELVTSKGE